jgi:hypothetical protein
MPGIGGETVVFELEAAVSSEHSWIAFGLSDDRRMVNSSANLLFLINAI